MALGSWSRRAGGAGAVYVASAWTCCRWLLGWQTDYRSPRRQLGRRRDHRLWRYSSGSSSPRRCGSARSRGSAGPSSHPPTRLQTPNHTLSAHPPGELRANNARTVHVKSANITRIVITSSNQPMESVYCIGAVDCRLAPSHPKCRPEWVTTCPPTSARRGVGHGGENPCHNQRKRQLRCPPSTLRIAPAGLTARKDRREGVAWKHRKRLWSHARRRVVNSALGSRLGASGSPARVLFPRSLRSAATGHRRGARNVALT